MTGTVSDTNLAAVTLNGLEVTLSPGSGAGNFVFESSLALPRGEQTSITLLAVDRAGNESSLNFELLSNPGPSIDVIQPLAGSEYIVFNNSQLIETIARVSDAPADSTLTIEAGTASNQQAVNQEIIASDLTVDADPSIDEIRFTLRDINGDTIASQAVPITIVDGANIPLELERTNPEQNDRYREPHTPVQFYFNRPVSLSDIVVDVRETVHGISYSNERVSGATLGEMYQGATVEVHKDQEPVNGALSLLPGGRIVEFYPNEDLSFGARVFVSLTYQSEQLTRFYYDVRSNPTFVKVSLKDQAGQAVPDVVVSVPELGFEGTPGIVFNMSVGYDLAGIRQANVQWFLDQMRDCSSHKQALIDVVGYLVLFLPVVTWLCLGLWEYWVEAYAIGEQSGQSAWNPQIWPFRLCFFLGFAFLFLQGIAELIKAVLFLMGETEHWEAGGGMGME